MKNNPFFTFDELTGRIIDNAGISVFYIGIGKPRTFATLAEAEAYLEREDNEAPNCNE